MKYSINSPKRVKFLIFMVFALLLIFLLGINYTNVNAKKHYLVSDNYLFQKYVDLRNTNQTWAVMYLWAYVQRDPPAYKYNTDGFRTWTDKEVKNLVTYIDQPRWKLKIVDNHLKSCGCYPCDKCQLKSSSGIGSISSGLSLAPPDTTIQIPPDTAMVCVDIYYEGKCNLLSKGIYNSATEIGLPNDSISSVMVGSNINVVLYVHGGLTGQSITFTSNNPDLTDDWIDNIYSWNDNTTSLQLVQK